MYAPVHNRTFRLRDTDKLLLQEIETLDSTRLRQALTKAELNHIQNILVKRVVAETTFDETIPMLLICHDAVNYPWYVLINILDRIRLQASCCQVRSAAASRHLGRTLLVFSQVSGCFKLGIWPVRYIQSLETVTDLKSLLTSRRFNLFHSFDTITSTHCRQLTSAIIKGLEHLHQVFLIALNPLGVSRIRQVTYLKNSNAVFCIVFNTKKVSQKAQYYADHRLPCLETFKIIKHSPLTLLVDAVAGGALNTTVTQTTKKRTQRKTDVLVQ